MLNKPLFVSLVIIAVLGASCGLPDEVPIIANPTAIESSPSSFTVKGQNNTPFLSGYGVNIYYRIFNGIEKKSAFLNDVVSWKEKSGQAIEQISGTLKYFPARFYKQDEGSLVVKSPAIELDKTLAWELLVQANLRGAQTESLIDLVQGETIYNIMRNFDNPRTDYFGEFSSNDFDLEAEIKAALIDGSNLPDLYVGLIIVVVGSSIDEGLLYSDPFSVGFYQITNYGSF